jgi:tetratricopeptide (TPR) repeat protein
MSVRSKPSKAPPKPQPKRTAEAAGRPSSLNLLISAGLLLAIFAVYAQVAQHEFLNYDDDLYVFQNSFVKAGLTLASLKWALTAVVVSNWMPVTLISHMLDCQLFGLASGMHHLTNVLFHALSTVLLFLVLHRSTRARWPSAFVAFLFALHPLHVESVAWVAERKDVLSTFFWLLALYGYVYYAERPSLRRYLLVAVPFCLGLMSKPMLVTFPFTLLLFDVWPLRRTQWPRTVLEKLPLFALSAAAAAITYFTQQSHGAFILTLSLGTRLKNALDSYMTYIVQTFLPVRLAAIYSYPNAIATWPAVIALLILLMVTVLAIFAWRQKRPYYAVGWFWYLGTLVPVIGLVQVGYTSHADRYTYVSLIGLSLMLAWGAVDLVQKWPWTQTIVISAAALFGVMCTALASTQITYWRDSETVFQHAIDVSPDNWVAHFNLGSYEMTTLKHTADAIPHFQATLRIRPDHAAARDFLGFCLLNTGHASDAVSHLEQVSRIRPNNGDTEASLGEALAKTPGRESEAIAHLQTALRLKPDDFEVNNDLGALMLNGGRISAAIPYLETAARLKPDSADVHLNLALALARTPARVADAIPQYEAALRLKPDYAAAHRSLGLLLARSGRTEEAIEHLSAAQRVEPDPAIAKTIESLRGGRK